MDRTWTDYVIPLGAGVVAMLKLPTPMSAKEWEQLMRVMAAMTPGLVEQ